MYEKTKKELRKPWIQMEEVYLVALKDRAGYFSEACPNSQCVLEAEEIKKFIGEMFKERERVCEKFMW